MGIFNSSSKFESQILNYKQDTEFEIICFGNKAQLSLVIVYIQCMFYWYKFPSNSSVNNIIHVHIESVYLVYHELFCQKRTW